MKKFKTFADILEAAKISQETFDKNSEGLEDNEKALRQLILIVKILNGSWKADFDNSSQYKYVNYFYWKNGAFVFITYCSLWSSSTNVPAGLCFKSAELAEYAGTTFIDIYNRYLKY